MFKKKEKIKGISEQKLLEMEEELVALDETILYERDEDMREKLLKHAHELATQIKEAQAIRETRRKAKLERKEKFVKIVMAVATPVVTVGTYIGLHILTQMWESNGGYYSSKMASRWAEHLSPKIREDK